MAGLALVMATAGTVRAEIDRTLRAVEVQPAADGTSVVLVLSAPAAPRVSALRGEGDRLLRVHVDLPAGTSLARGAVGTGLADPPVTGIRVGRTEGDRARVVIDVAGATGYRLERDADAATIRLRVVGERLASAPPLAPGRPAAAEPARRRIVRPKIVIDPGHGGDDPGAEGYALEKQVTLDIARRLAVLLRTRLGAEVVLTRTADHTLPLKERTARANRKGADLFVSIHANASDAGTLRGIETYYLDNSTDRGTLRLAKMENGLDLLAPTEDPGASLKYILSDLVQVGKLEDSARLARHVQRGLVGHLRSRYPGVVDLGVKRGPFYVLVGAYMPCVLVETAFLSHPVEGRRLARDGYREDVAQGLYAGIARFLSDTSRRRTL